jgi:hypothetical protein
MFERLGLIFLSLIYLAAICFDFELDSDFAIDAAAPVRRRLLRVALLATSRTK